MRNLDKIERRSRRLYKNSRSESGNILVITCIAFALVAVSLMMAYSFAGLFFVNNRLQASADEIALAGAKKLNDRDRIGQMNNMVARCRQLVFSSRRDYENTKSVFPDLEDFAEPLLTEAQDSSYELDRERQRIATLAQAEAKTAMQQKFNEIRPTFAMTLPWLKVGVPQITENNCGKIKDVESNVEELKAFKDLINNDESKAYVHIPNTPAPNPLSKGLTLYKADVQDGLKLPGPDDNLPFKLSSLPAPVERIIAPARVVLPGRVEKVPTGSAPSATRIGLRLKVETSLGFHGSGQMFALSAAETTGGCLQQ